MGVGVVVLGMHRSGTSMAARLINLLGPPAPVEKDLLLPDSGNPRGYWESSSLVEFNDRLLEAFGCDMTCPLDFSPGWEHDPRLDGFCGEARELFDRAFPSQSWVFKDPRNCLTFSFWVRALEVRPIVVLLHRNPCEIAVSYRNHWGDGEGIPYLFALWERYLRQALMQIRGLPVLVGSYANVVNGPTGWCEEVRKFLVRSGAAADEAPRAAILDFVDPLLRHVTSSRTDFLDNYAVTDAQRALFLVVEAVEGTHEAFVPPPLSAETPTTDALLLERRKAVRVKRELPAERWSRAWRDVRRSRYLTPARQVYKDMRSLGKVLEQRQEATVGRDEAAVGSRESRVSLPEPHE